VVPFVLQRGVERGIGLEARRSSDQGRLLGERRMADETAPRPGRVAPSHLHELAGLADRLGYHSIWVPETWGQDAATLLAVSIMTAWIPARRAAAIDPVQVLRSE